MKRSHFVLLLATAACLLGSQAVARGEGASSSAAQAAKNPEVARWEREAASVTITRDDWGIAHVHGKTDADAVFGMIYAQAEDDFNRVETNYINAMGRLAEAEGEGKIYQDLRMKLFIDPRNLEEGIRGEPGVAKEIDESRSRMD